MSERDYLTDRSDSFEDITDSPDHIQLVNLPGGSNNQLRYNINPVKTMGYGWKNEIILLQSHHWMDYPAFIRVINSFKFKPFSVKAVRDTMRTTLENLQNDIPFSESTQFPDKKIYIDLHHSVPLQLLKQLALALDISDRQVEKGRNETDVKADRAYSNFEDAKLACASAISALLDLVGPLPIENAHIFGVYTRATFESEHSLSFT